MEISTYFKHYNFFNDQRHTWNVDVIHFSWTKIFNLDAGSITIFSAEKKNNSKFTNIYCFQNMGKTNYWYN